MGRAIHVIAISLASLVATGCVTSAQVAIDEREDLSRYRTWNWLPQTPSVGTTPDPPATIQRVLTRDIAKRLHDNGFRRSRGPDFYVTYAYAQKSRLVVINEPRAIHELSSHHSSPSYVVEGSRQATHRYSELRLVIRFVTPEGATLWRARFAENEREQDALHLDGALSMLLERVPHRRVEDASGTTGCEPSAAGRVAGSEESATDGSASDRASSRPAESLPADRGSCPESEPETDPGQPLDELRQKSGRPIPA